MSQVRYIYLRDVKHQPVACIAVNLNKKNLIISYNFSVLNPLDRFDRDMARDLAVGRLCRDPLQIELNKEEAINSHVITRLILNDMLLLEDDLLPSRARKAAKRWLSINLSQEVTEADQKIINLFGSKAIRG